MANKEIKIKSFDKLQAFFQLTRMPMIHCAVQRRCPCYRHHYIVLGHTWRESYKICEIIHVSSGGECCKGRVKQEKYSKEQLEKDIKKGLYVYQNEDYPKNDDDYLKAYDRFLSRKDNTDYSISLKNCEHLVFYILTGRSVSYQLRELSCLERWLSDFIDLFTEGKKRTLCKVVLSASSLTGVDLYIEKKVKEILKQKRRHMHNLVFILRCVSFLIRALNFFLFSLDGIQPPKIPDIDFELLIDNWNSHSEIISKALRHKVVSERFRFISTGTCVFTVIGEVFIAYRTIKSSKQEKDNGAVNPEDFERKVVKEVCSCISGVFGNYATVDFLFVRYSNHFRHPGLRFCVGITGWFLSRFLGFGIMECCFRIRDVVTRYFNRLTLQICNFFIQSEPLSFE